jgi:cytochrome c553
VQREESIAHLTQAEQEAVQVSDEAMAKIEEFVSQQVTPPDEGEPQVKPLNSGRSLKRRLPRENAFKFVNGQGTLT